MKRGPVLHSFRWAAAFATIVLALAPRPARGQSDAAKRASAEALFEEANKLLDARQFAEACPKFVEVVKLLPEKVGARLALADCYEGAGKLASAWATLRECEALASRHQDFREAEARQKWQKIEPRLARLTITVPSHAPPNLVIRRDDTPLGEGQWGQPLPIDPGSYRIEASAPGRKDWSKTVEVEGEGRVVTVEIPQLEEAPAPAVQIQPNPGFARGDKPTSPDEVKLGHAWQPGAFVRSDIDGKLRGQVTIVGLSYGLGDHVDVGAGAAINNERQGLWAGATGYLLTGSLKPLAVAGTHVFLSDGVYAGLHGAVGMQWDPIRHFGVYALAGVSYFPVVPPPTPDTYEQLVFLPSVGVQGRL